MHIYLVGVKMVSTSSFVSISTHLDWKWCPGARAIFCKLHYTNIRCGIYLWCLKICWTIDLLSNQMLCFLFDSFSVEITQNVQCLCNMFQSQSSFCEQIPKNNSQGLFLMCCFEVEQFSTTDKLPVNHRVTKKSFGKSGEECAFLEFFSKCTFLLIGKGREDVSSFPRAASRMS